MKDGIHIPAGVVRIAFLAIAAAAVAIGISMFPEARRYLKIESM